MESLIRVALLMHADSEYSRGVIQGIVKYAQLGRGWLIHLFSPRPINVTALARWSPSGIIGHLPRLEQVRTVMEVGVPAVNVSGNSGELHMPRVGPDDQAIGETAAAYFVERGFTNLAFAGYSDNGYSERREAGFRKRLHAAGIETIRAYSDHSEPTVTDDCTQEGMANLCNWLKSAHKPLALFACDDARGRTVAEACRHAGLRVPDDVALLGCDNDELACRLADPPLSSIELPLQRIGHDAAALLERLMGGKPTSPDPILSAPGNVITRQSSDTLSVRDPHVAAALRFIRAHAGEWIGVREVLLNLQITRRSLERKFRQVLGRTPLQEIRRVRMEIAKDLLAHTDLAMPMVARRAGFSDAKQLSMVFHEEVGATPTAYRRRFRLHE